MKKLWWLSSIVLILLFSCNQRKHQTPAAEHRLADTDTTLPVKVMNDTLRSKADTTTQMPQLSNQHLPPDRKALDSIKKIKTKEKRVFSNKDNNN